MNTYNGKPSVTPPARYIAMNMSDALQRDRLNEYRLRNNITPTQLELEAACKAGREEYDRAQRGGAQ